MTVRQLQGDDGARVAHHGVAHQGPQALGIGGLARLAGGHIGGTKFLQRLEDARLEQREHVVKLAEIVLHRRRRQQKQEALVERVHQFVALARAVAQMMGLVNDDEVEAAVDEARGMFAPARQSERSDQARLVPEPIRVVPQQRVMGGRARNVELGLELLPPLPDERGRSEHERALDHPTQQILLEHHAGLDGLAESDLVGEQHAAAKLLEHLAHSLDLVPEGFDLAQVRQAQQLVEALREAEMGEALAQPVPTAITFRRVLHGGHERREIELGAERDIYVDQRQPRRSGRRGRRFGCRGRRSPVSRFARLDLDPILHPSPPGVGGSASAADSLVASEDAVVLAKEPCALRPAAGKDP